MSGCQESNEKNMSALIYANMFTFKVLLESVVMPDIAQLFVNCFT